MCECDRQVCKCATPTEMEARPARVKSSMAAVSSDFSTLAEQHTWEKLEALQHRPLLAEIHHQVAHVVAGFRLQGEAKGWGHCHAAGQR